MTKDQQKRVFEFLRDRRSIKSAFEGFDEATLREAVGMTNTKGVAVSWCNIANYLIVINKHYSHDFFAEAMMNAVEEILDMPPKEGRAWAGYFQSLIDRAQIVGD